MCVHDLNTTSLDLIYLILSMDLREVLTPIIKAKARWKTRILIGKSPNLHSFIHTKLKDLSLRYYRNVTYVS